MQKFLLSLQDKTKQMKLAKLVSEKNLSVRALEQAIKLKTNELSGVEVEKNALNMDIASKLAHELADQLQKKLGTKVEINYKSGKGQVSLHFYSDDQLTQIYDKLKA